MTCDHYIRKHSLQKWYRRVHGRACGTTKKMYIHHSTVAVPVNNLVQSINKWKSFFQITEIKFYCLRHICINVLLTCQKYKFFPKKNWRYLIHLPYHSSIFFSSLYICSIYSHIIIDITSWKTIFIYPTLQHSPKFE